MPKLFVKLHRVRESLVYSRWLNEYNSKRLHESLNNLTQEECLLMAEKTENSKSVWN
ncbi:hypothetical protein [Rouxiella badensis]|uniref:hypothetical protein n=1 Tax=Rouxiella badensis TaxID=1646377 RepID=UPI0004B5397C